MVVLQSSVFLFVLLPLVTFRQCLQFCSTDHSFQNHPLQQVLKANEYQVTNVRTTLDFHVASNQIFSVFVDFLDTSNCNMLISFVFSLSVFNKLKLLH